MEFPWNKTEWANVGNDLTSIFMRAAHNDDQKLQFQIPCSFIARNQYLLDKKGASSPWHPPYAHSFHLLIRYYYLYHAIWESAQFFVHVRASKELLCTGRNEQFNIFRESFSILNNVLHNSQSQAKPLCISFVSSLLLIRRRALESKCLSMWQESMLMKIKMRIVSIRAAWMMSSAKRMPFSLSLSRESAALLASSLNYYRTKCSVIPIIKKELLHTTRKNAEILRRENEVNDVVSGRTKRTPTTIHVAISIIAKDTKSLK